MNMYLKRLNVHMFALVAICLPLCAANNAPTSKQLSDALGLFLNNEAITRYIENVGTEGKQALSCLKGAALLAATGQIDDATNLIDVAQELLKSTASQGIALGKSKYPINLMLNMLKAGKTLL